jgi:hypothetical protein
MEERATATVLQQAELLGFERIENGDALGCYGHG